jgi:hypothetical protein
MMTKRKLFTFFLIFTLPLQVWGYSSLMWQKLKLEKELFDKVSENIKSLAPGVRNIVNIDVEVRPVEEPDFEAGSSPGSGGNDDDNKSKDKEKKESKKKRSIVRFTDDPGDKKRVDEIIFSKFGLRAPLVDDFTHNNNSLITPAKVDPPSPPRTINIEQERWKILNSNDISKYINKVDVNVTVDKNGLNEKLQAILSKTFTSYRWYIGDHKINLKLIFEPLTVIARQKTMSEKLLSYAKDFEVVLGFLVAGLFGLVSLLLFAKKLEKVFANKTSGAGAGGAAGSGGSSSNNKENNKETSKETQINVSDQGSAAIGIDKFIHFIKMFPHDGDVMLKKWVDSDSDEAKLKIEALTYTLETEQLATLLEKLNDEQRLRWKEKISKTLKEEERLRALELISHEVLELLVSPESKIAPETFEVMISLEPKHAAEFMKDHIELAPILYTELKPKMLSKIFECCDASTVQQVIESSLQFTSEGAGPLYQEFSQVISKYYEKKTKLPGANKARELIANVNEDNERIIFETLAKNTDQDLMMNYLVESFPTFLFKSLPEEFIKNALTSFNSDSRLQALYIMGDEGHFYRDLYAPDGSLAREMFDLELEKITFDKSLQKDIETNKRYITDAFTSHMREEVKNNSDFREDIEEKVKEWLGQQSSGGQKLKIAS